MGGFSADYVMWAGSDASDYEFAAAEFACWAGYFAFVGVGEGVVGDACFAYDAFIGMLL